MKYKITKEDGIIRIYDNKGNEVFYQDSNGYWVKRKFDNKGNKIYWENSNGKIIDNKPKENKIIEAKNLDDCLKKLNNIIIVK